MPKIQKVTSLAALALIASLAFAGCSGGDDEQAQDTSKETSQSSITSDDTESTDTDATDTESTDEADDSATDDESDADESDADDAADDEADDSSAGGDTPVWFEGSLDAGEQIGEGSTDTWDIKVFQVGTGKMDKDSMFVDPETNENILPKGDDVVFLNFVYTNTGDKAVPLGMIPDPRVRSANWPYAQGQPGVSTQSVYEEMGLSSDGYDITKFEGEPGDPYVVEPGQTVAIATSIKYEAGVDATAKPNFIPKDENGDLIHDQGEEAEITFTIK